MSVSEDTRANEWWVPRFGPRRFRLFVGLSFYPYSLMNASYVLIGSLVASTVHLDRMAGMAVVYLLAVGISAHSLDAMALNKPWGSFLSRTQLVVLAVTSLATACTIGLFYALTVAPFLLPVGVAELFFLFAYNLELLGGRFHTDFWFATSWGFLPVLAGFVVQTNTVTPTSLAAGLFGFFTASIEISASRPYKALKREVGSANFLLASRFESVLKGVVASVLATALFLMIRSIVG